MITINECMTSEPYTLRETDSIINAWEIMTDKNIRHIPVTDSNNHVLGIVSQRDVLAATAPGLMQESKNIKLSDIMIRSVTVVHESDSLRQAAVYLQSHKYGCLPVVSDNRLVGIITDSDFIAIAINLLEQVELSEDGVEEEDMIDNLDSLKLSEIT